MSGGPGDLQVESAGEGVQIQKLSRQVKAGNQSGFHGGGIDLPDADAASGDDGFRKASRSGHGKLHVLDAGNKALTLLAGDVVHPLLWIDAGKGDHHGNQTGGEQGVHGVSKLAVLRFLKIPQKPSVQLLFRKSRL